MKSRPLHSNQQRSSIASDILRAVQLWPVWLRLGLQDLRLRFRRSRLGISWIFINLILMVLAIGLVYGTLLGQDFADFLPFLTASLVIWGYITASITEGGNAFILAEGYIKQIGLPPSIYVFRSFVHISLTALISLAAYVCIALIYRVPFSLGLVWIFPGLALLGLTSLCLIAIFAHLNARFRDVAHVAGLSLQIAFYITPVLWPPELLQASSLGWLVDWNPFYHLLQVVRQPLLHSQAATAPNYITVGLFIAGLLCIALQVTRRYHRQLVYFL